MKEGKLIVFEGPEGAGKSTQIKFLSERLEKAGIAVVKSKEPYGDFRKKLLYGKPSPREELELFLKNRAEHFSQLVLKSLAEGKWVLIDRSSPSTIAYQHFGRGLDLEEIKKKDEAARQGRDFDLIVLLDGEPEVLLKRLPGRKEKATRFEEEDLDFHRRVREGYLKQQKWNPGKWLKINATKSEEEIVDIIWREIQKRFL